jgi:hypothetical protein
MYNDQKLIGKEYFEKKRVIDVDSNNNKANVELMIEFLDKKYNGVINPTNLKNFFEKCKI